MFCYQCQETAKGTGCTVKGVCGKTEDVANLQDLLVFVAKGISVLAEIAGQHNISTKEADKFVMEALFTTITNANFDRGAVVQKIREGYNVRSLLRQRIEHNGI
ncbi:MAG: hydroxylamine reductase, partial [Bacteroidales bacterium]|nr:hydroxylamine reductase [Bacteroidales bacterium]